MRSGAQWWIVLNHYRSIRCKDAKDLLWKYLFLSHSYVLTKFVLSRCDCGKCYLCSWFKGQNEHVTWLSSSLLNGQKRPNLYWYTLYPSNFWLFSRCGTSICIWLHQFLHWDPRFGEVWRQTVIIQQSCVTSRVHLSLCAGPFSTGLDGAVAWGYRNLSARKGACRGILVHKRERNLAGSSDWCHPWLSIYCSVSGGRSLYWAWQASQHSKRRDEEA